MRATELHGHETGKGHADAIRYGCRDNYGAAGRYWIEYLANHKDAAREAYATATRRWAKLIPSTYGEQVQRASDRFAAIEAALLAGRIVTGWSEQDCIDTVQTVFNVWVKEFGTGNKEIQQIVEQAEGFLTASGFSRYLPYRIPMNGICLSVNLLVTERAAFAMKVKFSSFTHFHMSLRKRLRQDLTLSILLRLFRRLEC
ncbi:Superfamily II helicase and inactivated derivatives [Budvicia aquatica]|uniref:Superfamily II helicase and inactivated derivatives n=1 Tax=Budvicia aquatica TaxID=82979 RepID=A0A484ZJA4_9GAMM|nr:Superfamily II helicase and inactivated derivatives [Budvicia aquatica]